MLPGTDNPEDMGGTGNILQMATYRKWTALWAAEQGMKCLFTCDLGKTRVLKRHKIEVLFGLLLMYRYDRVPILSWIPDFQHIRLPEMFIASERRQRDRIFLRTTKISRQVILMSQSVKKDFEAFFPQYAGKARVLRACKRDS